MKGDARARRRARRIRWGVRLGRWVLRVLAPTWRVTEVRGELIRGFEARGEAFVALFWHGQLLPLIWWHRHRGIAMMVSEHGDGEIISQAGAALGFGLVRGSSSRGGERALLEATRLAAAGTPVAISPDGPRGPRHSMAPGAMLVSSRAGAPLLLVAAAADRAWRLDSWDRFLIPKPFARVTIGYDVQPPVAAGSAREAAARAPAVREQLLRLNEAIGA